MKIFLLSALFLLGAIDVSAQGYKPLAPIPQLTQNGSTSSSFFLQNLVPLLISIAGGLAVIRIIIGGVQYMTTDAWNGKADAKSTIQQALLGLLLAMASYTILYTLNPELLNIKIAPASQNAGGDALSPNSVVQTTKNAEELGCTDRCETIEGEEIRIRVGACSNTPCYSYYLINYNLARIDDLTWTSGSTTRQVAWQITKAFPQASTSDACYKAGNSSPAAGKCVEISVPNPGANSIGVLVAALEKDFGSKFKRYNVCPLSRVSNILTAVTNDSGASITERVRPKVRCFDANETETARIDMR